MPHRVSGIETDRQSDRRNALLKAAPLRLSEEFIIIPSHHSHVYNADRVAAKLEITNWCTQLTAYRRCRWLLLLSPAPAVATAATAAAAACKMTYYVPL